MSLYKRHEEARREAYRKGAWTAVIKYGEAGLKTDPEDIKALNDLAYAYYKKAQYDRALEMCERIYHLHPCEDLASQAKELGTRYMRHHEVLAEMYFLRGNDEAALGICEKLKPLDPLFSRKYVIESQIRLRQGNLQAAARQYGEMGIKCPHHYKEALNGLFEIARDNPLEEPVFREIFLLYESHNEVADAISRHEQLYRDGRTDAANFYILAHLYHFEKANKNEIALIEQQMLSHPDDAGLYALLARTYQAMQKQSGAKSCKEQALRLAPDKSDDFQRLWEPVEAEKAENQETRTPPRALEIQEKSWWQQSKRHDKAREQAYQQGSWHDVIRHGEEELRQDAGNIRAMNDLAYAYYKKSEFDRALDLCKAIYRQHPCDDLSQQARELGPRYMRYHEVMAEIYFLRGRDKEALAACKSLKVLDPMFSRKYAIAAEIYARRGNQDLAAGQYAAMAVNCPKHFKEALNGLIELTRLDPLQEGPFKELYALYIENEQLSQVIARHERAFHAGKADASGFYMLSHMYRFTGEIEKETGIVRQWMKDHRDDPGPHVLLARVHQDRQEFSAATSCMQRAMALAPGESDRFNALWEDMREKEQRIRRDLEADFRTSMDGRQFHKAMQECEQLTTLFPDDMSFRQKMAEAIDAAIEVAMTAGDMEEAISLLEKLSGLEDVSPAVSKQLARRQAQLADRCVDYYEEQIEQENLPRNELGEAHLTLAEIYMQRGNTDGAIRHWKAVVLSGAKGAEEALYQLARYYLDAGDPMAAESYVQQYSHIPCEAQAVMERMYGLAQTCVKAGLTHQGRSLFGSLYNADKSYRDVSRQLEALNQQGRSEESPEAVMVLDICESSRMMDLYGDGITNQIKSLLEEFVFPVFDANRSKFCKSTGDGFLVSFPSVEQAVKAAISILQGLESFNAESHERPDVHLRFAIHFGAVRIRLDGDRHGTNVNIPFRVEGLKAEGLTEVEGGMAPEDIPLRDRILMTEAAYQALPENYNNCRLVGLFELRNITGMHRIYQVLEPEASH